MSASNPSAASSAPFGGLSGGRGRRDVAPRRRSARANASVILLVVDLVVLNMAVLHIHGPARLVLGLVFSLFVPGWAVVGPIRLGDAALEIALTMAASLALLMLTAQVLMSFQIWHLVAFEEVTCLLCLPSLVWQSMDLQRSTGNPSQ